MFLWRDDPRSSPVFINNSFFPVRSVTGGELFEDIVAREYYSEADARYRSRHCVFSCMLISFFWGGGQL